MCLLFIIDDATSELVCQVRCHVMSCDIVSFVIIRAELNNFCVN